MNDNLNPEPEYAEAFEWAKKSAEQGCAEGYYSLAICYYNGIGTDEDYAKAAEYYQKGADAGNDSCMTNLAMMYINGEYFDEDEEKAFVLFKKAAELGNGVAMRNLGRCYQFAMGVEEDMEKAAEWYENALEFFPDDTEFQMKTALLRQSVDRQNGKISSEDSLDMVKNLLGLDFDDEDTDDDEDDNEDNDDESDMFGFDAEMGAMVDIFTYGEDHGNPTKMNEIANSDNEIEIVERDAEAGVPKAQYILAKLYFVQGGRNGIEIWKKAVEYMNSACEAGYNDAVEFVEEHSDIMEDFEYFKIISGADNDDEDNNEEVEDEIDDNDEIEDDDEDDILDVFCVSGKGKTITVNDDFTIFVDDGMFYTKGTSGTIGETVKIIKIGRLREEKRGIKGEAKISSDDYDFTVTIMAREYEDGQYEGLMSDMDFAKSIEEESSGSYRVFKDEENFKVGYFVQHQDSGLTMFMIKIITPKALYMAAAIFTGNFFTYLMGDTDEDDEMYLSKLCETIELTPEAAEVCHSITPLIKFKTKSFEYMTPFKAALVNFILNIPKQTS